MAKDFYIKSFGPRGNKTYEVYRRGGGQMYYSDNRQGASQYMARLQREENERRREEKRRRNAPARKRNPPLSKSLSNFTGRVGITADGRLNIQGVQMRKNSGRKRK